VADDRQAVVLHRDGGCGEGIGDAAAGCQKQNHEHG
jgi:hypothetical protein